MPMRVLILVNASFAVRERAMLARLEVGLADEGAVVVYGVPEDLPAADHGARLGRVVSYQARGLPLTLSSRARRVVQQLDGGQRPTDDARVLEVVHVFGGGAWRLGAEIADMTGAALGLEIWCRDLVGACSRLPARELLGVPTVLFAPDPALERDVRAAAGTAASVRAIPWGTHTPAEAPPRFPEGRAPSLFIGGGGTQGERYWEVMRALESVCRDRPDVLAFVDADAAQGSRWWDAVGQFGLLERVTLIPNMEERRDLTLAGDVLILPEALGEHRSITLDAMAAGMVVVAAADRDVAYLIDGKTARIVDSPAAERWAAVLAGLLDDPSHARALGKSARTHVRDHHRATAQVTAVLDAYEWMTAGESLPFGRP